MSLLIVLIPPRERLQAGDRPLPARSAAEFSYVTSSDGLAVTSHGRCAPALLPKATSVVAVLADSDVSWQRIVLPRAPAARLRAALIGVLEEALLDDAESMHFALAPDAVAGQPAWVAAMHREWLQAHITTLEKSGIPVERILPSSWPDKPALGHFAEAQGADTDAPLSLTWSDGDGVLCLRLHGGMARSLLTQWNQDDTHWSATPAAAADAEQWLGAPVQVSGSEERALLAARSLWNLRQFDLAARHRGMLALRDGLRQFWSAEWRPVRWGIAALVLMQVVGLNLWAWHQQGEMRARRLAMGELLKIAHPQVRAVLDAPVQMQRETELLRTAAGKPGDNDLEPLLYAAASAWPDGMAPAASLRFEPGRLSFSAGAWSTPQIEQFRNQLKPAGYAVETSNGAITVSRAAAAS
jgi:general secretion pathway protein L